MPMTSDAPWSQVAPKVAFGGKQAITSLGSHSVMLVVHAVFSAGGGLSPQSPW